MKKIYFLVFVVVGMLEIFAKGLEVRYGFNYYYFLIHSPNHYPYSAYPKIEAGLFFEFPRIIFGQILKITKINKNALQWFFYIS